MKTGVFHPLKATCPLSPHYLCQGCGQQAGSGEAASFSASHKVARMKLASSSRSSMLKAMGLNTSIEKAQGITDPVRGDTDSVILPMELENTPLKR